MILLFLINIMNKVIIYIKNIINKYIYLFFSLEYNIIKSN